jgi:hypothetical protein
MSQCKEILVPVIRFISVDLIDQSIVKIFFQGCFGRIPVGGSHRLSQSGKKLRRQKNFGNQVLAAETDRE